MGKLDTAYNALADAAAPLCTGGLPLPDKETNRLMPKYLLYKKQFDVATEALKGVKDDSSYGIDNYPQGLSGSLKPWVQENFCN